MIDTLSTGADYSGTELTSIPGLGAQAGKSEGGNIVRLALASIHGFITGFLILQVCQLAGASTFITYCLLALAGVQCLLEGATCDRE